MASFSGRTKWKLDGHPPVDFYPAVQQPIRRRICPLARDVRLMLLVSDWPNLNWPAPEPITVLWEI